MSIVRRIFPSDTDALRPRLAPAQALTTASRPLMPDGGHCRGDLQDGELAIATGNVLLSLLVGLGAIALGRFIGGHL